jgi:phosphoribosylanthranilate isomerase
VTRIKICGITNTEDAQAAVDYGADMLGFIFVSQSPRFVGQDTQRVRRLLHDIPPLIWRVGVFDTPNADFSGPPELHAVQYYNSPTLVQSGTFAPYSHTPVPIKAFRVRDEESLKEIVTDKDPKEIILLDAFSPHALGGTGHTFNWDLAQQVKRLGLPIILAGGLTPDNVAEAVAAVRPFGVDVSSGVEAEPGRKDLGKVRAFIQAVRSADLAYSAR